MEGERFFRFDKELIRGPEMKWSKLPKSSRAILPAILLHVNKDGEARPGERRIAELSGLSERSTRNGIRGLRGVQGIEVVFRRTEHGKTFLKFRLPEVTSYQKGRFFLFHSMIIDGGYWARLSFPAKSLYPVLRTFAYFDFDLYNDVVEDHDLPFPKLEEFTYEESSKVYAERPFEFVRMSFRNMSRFAGLSPSKVYQGLRDLRRARLVMEFEEFENLEKGPGGRGNISTRIVSLLPWECLLREWEYFLSK